MQINGTHIGSMSHYAVSTPNSEDGCINYINDDYLKVYFIMITGEDVNAFGIILNNRGTSKIK